MKWRISSPMAAVQAMQTAHVRPVVVNALAIPNGGQAPTGATAVMIRRVSRINGAPISDGGFQGTEAAEAPRSSGPGLRGTSGASGKTGPRAARNQGNRARERRVRRAEARIRCRVHERVAGPMARERIS